MASDGKVLHLFSWDKKFAPPFIDFVDEHFAIEDHRFIIHGDVDKEDLPPAEHIIHYPSLLRKAGPLVAEMHAARKIIIHGLFSSHLLYLLMLQPWLLKKCYWTIWGGDLYVHDAEQKDWRWHKNEWVRRFVIPRLGHFITHVYGDYELAQKWYGAKGQWHECFMYTSNLYRDYQIEPKPHDGIHILLGNSATASNNHLDAFEKLRPFAHENIIIYCPLSYGDSSYGDLVVRAGKEIFGKKFEPIRKIIPIDKYINFLSDIDIAVFNHNRQQGMGNITTLLGLGKQVYMPSSLTSWRAFKSLNVKIFDIKELLTLSKNPYIENKEKIANYFSINNLIKQWQAIFLGEKYLNELFNRKRN